MSSEPFLTTEFVGFAALGGLVVSWHDAFGSRIRISTADPSRARSPPFCVLQAGGRWPGPGFLRRNCGSGRQARAPPSTAARMAPSPNVLHSLIRHFGVSRTAAGVHSRLNELLGA